MFNSLFYVETIHGIVDKERNLLIATRTRVHADYLYLKCMK